MERLEPLSSMHEVKLNILYHRHKNGHFADRFKDDHPRKIKEKTEKYFPCPFSPNDARNVSGTARYVFKFP